MRLIGSLLLLAAVLTGAYAQRPRSIEPEPAKKTTTAPAPVTSAVKAKYEGGVFGYTKTMEGTLAFDDANSQLIFKDQKTPKQLHIPYDAVTSAFADTQKRQPGAATVASNVPSIYALPAHFIKTKVRYLTVQYSDPDSHQSGITSFKLENKEILNSFLVSLAQKTGMTQRGDIYVKKTDVSKTLP
jgi:hypothetical protein